MIPQRNPYRSLNRTLIDPVKEPDNLPLTRAQDLEPVGADEDAVENGHQDWHHKRSEDVDQVHIPYYPNKPQK